MTKKIISLFMSFLLILNVIAVFADSSDKEYTFINYNKYDMMKGLLTTLEIIDENNMPGSKHELTRGEFAGYVEKMTNATVMSPDKNVFWDVAEDYKYKSAVNLLVGMGCISGNPDGTFQPNEPVTEGAAVKILVCLLGYKDYVESTGGYYMGYYNVAQKIGLVSKDLLGANTKLTEEAFVELMYKALVVPVADISSVIVNPNGELTGVIDNTDRKTLLERYYNIYFTDGIVEANSYANINYNGSSKDGVISIDSVKYSADKPYDKYLGYNVRCFYELNKETDVKTVKYMHPTTDTAVYELLPDAGTQVSGNTISFYNGERRIERNVDAEDLCVLKNGQHINYGNQFNNKLFDIDTGKIVLVDNDEDNVIEFISVTEYEDMMVYSINEEEMILYESSEKPSVAIDENGYYIITDTLGNNLAFKDIETNTVLSYAQSENKKIIEIILSYDYIEGKLEQIEIEQDYYVLTIDSNTYQALKDDFETKDLLPGSTYTFYFNYMGNIIRAQEVTKSGLALGYLAQIGNTGSFGQCSAQIMDAKSVLHVYEFANKVIIDGEIKKENEIKEYFDKKFPVIEPERYIKEIIRYSLNDKNEIVEVDTTVYNPNNESENTLRARYEGDRLRWQGGNSTVQRFHVTGTDAEKAGFPTGTMFMYGCTADVFAVAEPKIEEGDSDIEIENTVVYSNVPIEKGTQGISAKLYSINDNTPIFCGAVIKNGTAVAGIGSLLYIVAGKGLSLDDNGDERRYLKLINGDVESKLFISEKYTSDASLGDAGTGESTAYEDINIGDIIRYSPDSRGDIQYCLTVFDYPTREFKARGTWMTQDPKVTGGIVYDVNDIFVRIMAMYKDLDGVTRNITPTNVNDAISDTLYWLTDNYNSEGTKLMSREPNETDAIDALGELVYFGSVSSYEVVQNKVIFSTLTASEIPDYVHAGSDCATIIITTSLGNLPTKSAIVIK